MKPGVYDIWNIDTKKYAGRTIIEEESEGSIYFKYAWAHSLEDIPSIDSALENGWYLFEMNGGYRRALELKDGKLYDEDGDLEDTYDLDEFKAVAKFGELEEIKND
jgi:hypothetical protein